MTLCSGIYIVLTDRRYIGRNVWLGAESRLVPPRSAAPGSASDALASRPA